MPCPGALLFIDFMNEWNALVVLVVYAHPPLEACMHEIVCGPTTNTTACWKNQAHRKIRLTVRKKLNGDALR